MLVSLVKEGIICAPIKSISRGTESNEFIGDLDQLFHDPNSLVSSSDIIDIIENGPVEGVSDGGAPYHEHTRLSDKAELAKSACSKIAESEQREPGIEKPTQIEAK